MKFTPLSLAGAYCLEPALLADERGFFARTFCAGEFAQHGLNSQVIQCNVSYNRTAGTLRGMHYQVAPQAETKVVHCTAGAIYDVLVDLRPDSPTYCAWEGVELSAANRLALYIPEGLAHGFLTLTDDAEVFYLMGAAYAPECARGVRHDDSAFGIRWPAPVQVISKRDGAYPDFLP